MNYFDYYLIINISCLQISVFFFVFYLFVKQIFIIFSGSTNIIRMKMKKPENYFPFLYFNNSEKEVK